MLFLYIIVFVFTFISQTQYFNPIFLLFGYHYYHVLTPQGTKVFIIARGKVIRNKSYLAFDNGKLYIENGQSDKPCPAVFICG